MTSKSQAAPLTIRIHLTDGSVQAFTQPDETINQKLWDEIEPSRLFMQQRIVIGSEHSKSVFVAAELPAESQSFMQFMLSKAAVHMRLRGGGIGVVNLANLAGYAVYPGVAQIPGDSWLAEPVSEPAN